MSNDMKGMPELGWNGGVGTRRCWRFGPAMVGFPADGKDTGGILNSFSMMLRLRDLAGGRESVVKLGF